MLAVKYHPGFLLSFLISFLWRDKYTLIFYVNSNCAELSLLKENIWGSLSKKFIGPKWVGFNLYWLHMISMNFHWSFCYFIYINLSVTLVPHPWAPVQGQVEWGFEQWSSEMCPAPERGLWICWSLRSLPTQGVLWFICFFCFQIFSHHLEAFPDITMVPQVFQ